MIGISVSPLRPKKFGISYDADALAFFTAAGITSTTQKSAVNTLVSGLKSNSLWTKFNAIYPMVGGTATSHKFNLVNPVDSNAAFRLSFIGGWTHSSNGALPNGTNGVADTFLNANTTLSLNDNHISFYSRTQNAVNGVDIGCSSGAAPHYDIEIYYASRFYSNFADYGAGTSGAVTTGFFLNSRIASGSYKGYRNASIEQTNVITSTTKPNYTLTLGARNNAGVPAFWANRECAFASIGSGLTDGEVSTLNTLVTNFQTTLGRNV